MTVDMKIVLATYVVSSWMCCAALVHLLSLDDVVVNSYISMCFIDCVKLELKVLLMLD